MTASREAALARSQGVRAAADRPSQRRAMEADDAPRAVRCSVLAPTHARSADGSEETHVGGVASVVEQGYEMYDMFGPYTEVVARDAFDKTLADNPLVEFTLNHARNGGAPMAHTRNGTLVLTSTEAGLEYDAVVDPSRSDVSDVLKALTRGDLAEASFKFSIVRGQWSPDYTEYRIAEVDLDRGDVSAVNFGANPAATSGLRAMQPEAAPTARARVYDDELQDRIS
jgi:HK97 family phage prohead protease